MPRRSVEGSRAALGRSPRGRTRQPPTVLILHGVNIWNTGDLGLLEASVGRLRDELGADVRIWCEDAFGQPIERVHPHLEALDIELTPALVGVRHHAGSGKLSFLGRMLVVAAGAIIVRILGRKALRALPATVAAPLRTMLDADVIVSKAGGHLYSTKDRRIGASSYLVTIWVATLLRRPTVIYAQSVGPFSGWLADRVARMALRGASLATAREPRSFEWLSHVVPSSKLHLTADEAFLLADPVEAPRPAVLGMTAVTWRFPGHPDPDRARLSYEEALVEVARWYIDERGGDVRFVRWLSGGHREDDRELIDRLVRRIDRPGRIEAIGPFAPVAASRKLGEMELIVASRLHSAIFAMVAGTPAVAIEYLPKTSEVMDMVSDRPAWVPIDGVGEGRLLRAVQDASATLDERRAELRERLPKVRARARENAALVRRLLLDGSAS